MSQKLLFLSNKRSIPNGDNSYNTLESGLVNSIKFIIKMLNQNGFDATYIQVNDHNDVDREVYKLKPNIVIIEAIWASPDKLKELKKLHPLVKWVIRIHSEMPFISNEGNAMDWIFQYSNIENVSISFNSERMLNQMKFLNCQTYYLPNWYGGKIENSGNKPFSENVINIGCFGAIRPMKNHLMQAISAIDFVDKLNQPLNFHININREETGGNAVLKNLRSLFKNTKHNLVEHPWATHEEFIEIIRKMDLSMQISFSETFNIVTADAVANYIPVVVSNEIGWLSKSVSADPNNSKDIIDKLNSCRERAMRNTDMILNNIKHLENSNDTSMKVWIEYLK